MQEVNPKDYHTKLLLDRENVTDTDSWLSKSAIWEYMQGSPFCWRYYPKRFSPTAAMVHGTLVDTLVTCPNEFDDICVVSPDTVSVLPRKYVVTSRDYPGKWSGNNSDCKGWKADAESKGYTVLTGSQYDKIKDPKPWSKAIDYCKQWESDRESEGKTVVTSKQLEEGKKAADMLMNKCRASQKIIIESRSQVLLAVTASQLKEAGFDLGVNLKGLADFVPVNGDYLCDLKTTADFSYKGFERTAAKFGYAYQAALYLVIWNLTNPEDQRESFKIIWQSSSAPYEVAVSEISLADINTAKTKLKAVIEDIVKCSKRKQWPMKYEGQMLKLVLPDWANDEGVQVVEGEA